MTLESRLGSPLEKYAGKGIGGHEERKLGNIIKPFPKLQYLLNLYKKSLKRGPLLRDSEVKEFIDFALTPIQINGFLQAISENYHNTPAEAIIRQLIINSYPTYDKFTFNTITFAKPPCDFLRSCKYGLSYDDIKIIVNGDLGDDAFKCAEYMEIAINGKTGDRTAWEARHCKINLKKTGKYTGQLASNCAFETNFQETYEQLKRDVQKDSDNKIIYKRKEETI